MFDDLFGCPLRHCHRVRVSELAEQIEAELQLPLQLLGADLLLRRGEQDIRQQAYRRHRRGRVDAAHDFAAQLVDDFIQPRRPLTILARVLAPARPHTVEQRFQFHGFSDIDVDATEIFAKRLDRADQAKQ